MQRLWCLVIFFTPLLGGCVAGKQPKPTSRVETAGAVTPAQSASTQPVDTSGITSSWPSQAKDYDIINSAMETAVIAAYVDTSHRWRQDGRFPALVFAVWKDGRVIRSANSIKGGVPFLQGFVPRASVSDSIQQLTLRAVESNVEPRTLHSGPHYPQTFLQFRTIDGHVYELISWHEVMEEDGDVLYGRGWMQVTAKEQIPAIIASRTPAYQEFREVWESLRATINDLFPRDMDAIEMPGFRFRNVRNGALEK